MDKEKTTYELPKGWIWTNIPELFTIVGGGTPSKNNSHYWGGNINWASVKDIKSQFLTETIDKITNEGLENSSTSIANIGDVLLVTRISPGQVSIAKQKTAVNQDLKILKCFGGVNPSFAYFLIKSQSHQFISNASGTTVKGLKISTLNKIKLPLPPLNEQNQIVSKIDELFSELDHAEKGLQKTKQQLDVYRQVLLKNAFERSQPIALGCFTKLITKGSSPNWQGIKYTEDRSQTLFITSENIQVNFISLDKRKYVERRFDEKQKRSILEEGDVLLNIVGASIGRAAVFRIEANANINQAVCLIRIVGELEPQYLAYFLNSPLAIKYFQSRIVDVARANLSLKDVSEIPIPYCERNKQLDIIQKLESQYTLIENLEKAIKKSLNDIEVFRHSVLKRAFEGKLLIQNPLDEPAILLIKKIGIEKEAYIKFQTETEKLKPQKKRQMETKKKVLEILQEVDKPMSAKELWQKSIHSDDIESFYAELKEIYSKLIEVKQNTESLLSIKK